MGRPCWPGWCWRRPFPRSAWPGWESVLTQPLEAKARPELNIERIRVFRSEDGFTVAWLELGPLAPRLAMSER